MCYSGLDVDGIVIMRGKTIISLGALVDASWETFTALATI